MNTFEIALKTKQLPDKIEDLVPMMFAGQAAVRFMAAKLKAVSDKNISDPMGLLEEQRQKTVEDGQAIGEMLLAVMGRIGKLSENVGPAKPTILRGIGTGRSTHQKSQEPLKYQKLGLKSRGQLKQAQFINRNPDLVKETIAECRKNDDIPNITTVLHKHKIKKMMEKHPAKENEMPDVNRVTLDVYNRLTDCYSKLTQIYKHKDLLSKSMREDMEEITEKIYNLVR
jgi:hypothetical protein